MLVFTAAGAQRVSTARHRYRVMPKDVPEVTRSQPQEVGGGEPREPQGSEPPAKRKRPSD